MTIREIVSIITIATGAGILIAWTVSRPATNTILGADGVWDCTGPTAASTVCIKRIERK
jgi:hypothetical protein